MIQQRWNRLSARDDSVIVKVYFLHAVFRDHLDQNLETTSVTE